MSLTAAVNVTSDGNTSLDALTVTADGTTVVERNLSGAVVADGQSAAVGAVVPLSTGGNRVELTVTGNGGATTANATVLLDGDGLNATYEREVLGTDPLDPDSDSAATAADESGNGTVDGREDFDGDALSTLRELELGTDPLAADTDADGLTDREEFITETDPLDPDTNDDGYWDGWIGVYGVGYSENVIQYRENLQSGNGTEGDEIVSEQAGVHNATGTNMPGADIFNNDTGSCPI